MEKKILTEINRYRELMNLSILNEGRGELGTDILKAANKIFANAAFNTPEDILKRDLIRAESIGESEIKKVLRSAPDQKLVRKIMKEAIIISENKFFIQMEQVIQYFVNEGKSSDFIKRKLEEKFNTNVSGELAEDFLKTYKRSVDLLYGGRTPQQVFGRDVGPYKPKPKPDTNNLPSTTNVTKFVDNIETKLENDPVFKNLNSSIQRDIRNNIHKIESQCLDEKGLTNWINTEANAIVEGRFRAGEIKKAERDRLMGQLSSYADTFKKSADIIGKTVPSALKTFFYLAGGFLILGILYKIFKGGTNLTGTSEEQDEIIDIVQDQIGIGKTPTPEETTPAPTETTPAPAETETTPATEDGDGGSLDDEDY